VGRNVAVLFAVSIVTVPAVTGLTVNVAALMVDASIALLKVAVRAARIDALEPPLDGLVERTVGGPVSTVSLLPPVPPPAPPPHDIVSPAAKNRASKAYEPFMIFLNISSSPGSLFANDCSSPDRVRTGINATLWHHARLSVNVYYG
jgi:hypothetical protein